jgi:hypothetical protein
MTKLLFAALSLSLFIGCGSSAEPVQSDPTLVPDAGAPDDVGAPAPAKRTLVSRGRLPGAPQNLLLDVTFRDNGWGHFTSFYDGAMSQPSVGVRVLSLAPAGVSAPVATFKDSAATDEKSKGITSIASFLGGKGPFVARVWVSRTNVAGEPRPLEDDALVFRAALTTGGLPEGKAYDLARKDERLVGDRTWTLFEGRVDDALPGTAFFNLKFGRKGGGYLVQAPEVTPLRLLPAGESTMVKPFVVKPRALAPEEYEAIAFYQRQPVQLGLPKLPRFVPGMKAPAAD